MILSNKIKWSDLFREDNFYSDIVKAVVDIEQSIIAVEAEWHADLELELIEAGSFSRNLWGINFHHNFMEIEYDSLINIKPNQNRSMTVECHNTRERIKKICEQWIVE